MRKKIIIDVDLYGETNRKKIKMIQEEYWENRAKEHGDTVKAVNNDLLAEQLEYEEILKYIKKGDKVLDMGCGNGLLMQYLKGEVGCEIEGVELTKSLSKMARKKGFKVFTCNSGDPFLSEEFGAEVFDVIITKRLLVNLDDEDTGETFKNIKTMLKPNGKYLMVECFCEPLERTNDIRRKMRLPKIEVDEAHNHYLNQNIIEFVPMKLIETNDFMSFYYLISRTINAKMFEADYTSTLNLVSARMDTNVKGYAPEVMHIFKKND